MTEKIYYKNLNERPFNAILNGTKTVEIRANKKVYVGSSINVIEPGDTIVFTKVGSNQKLRCVVERKTLYSSVRELLESEGTEYTLSSTNDIEQGITSVESISNYKEWRFCITAQRYMSYLADLT